MNTSESVENRIYLDGKCYLLVLLELQPMLGVHHLYRMTKIEFSSAVSFKFEHQSKDYLSESQIVSSITQKAETVKHTCDKSSRCISEFVGVE